MNETSGPRPVDPGIVEVDGKVVLFGFPSSEVAVRVRPRPFAWRAGGAARTMAIFLVVTPVVMIVPPHAPWAIGAFVTGVVLARRRWKERYTLVGLDGVCPKCGAPLRVSSGRLRAPHPVPCESCHHEGTLTIPPGSLREETG